MRLLLIFSLYRGGGERGLSWHRKGKVEGKEKGVEDLQACLHELFSRGVSFPSLAALTACSAGAVPVGALCNRKPNMMRAVALQVRLSLPDPSRKHDVYHQLICTHENTYSSRSP